VTVILEKLQCDRGMPDSFPIPLYDVATHCEKCGRPLGHPVHRDWLLMRARVSAQLVEREAIWNPFAGATPPQGLFQTMPSSPFQSYRIGADVGREGDEVVIIGPIEDSLRNFKPIRWASEWGEGEFDGNT
jgi:hypothetical protein